MLKRVILNISVLIVTLIVIEESLRASGLLLTIFEYNGGTHAPQFNEKRETWFHTWSPNSIINYEQKEFQYIYKINEWGNREKTTDFFIDKNKDAIKIVCLGDSFTEGDGAPYDSSWVRSLEHLLNKNGIRNYLLYNAGNSGSDVFYNYIQLKERLLKIEPDVVLELINDSDIYDVVYAGGLERFNKDGTVSYKTGRKWEKLYIHSHIVRLFVRVFLGYDSLLMNKKDKKEAIDKIIMQVQRTKKLCEEKNIRYLAFFHPTPRNIREGKQEEITCLEQKFKTLNYVSSLTDEMENEFSNLNVSRYSWVENYHFNSYDYWEMGKFIYEKLREKDEKIIK